MKINNLKWLRYTLVYIVIWCISPPLSYGLVFRVLAIAAMGYIIRYYCVINKLKVKKHFVATVFLIIYMVILSVATGDGAGFRIGTYIFLCIMLSAEIFTNDEIDKKQFYFIIPAIFFLCIIWNLCSLKGIQEIPNIMRLLVRNSDFSEFYAKKGIGGYGYIYTVLILLPIGIDYLLNKRNEIRYRVLAVIYVITTYMLVFQAQYFLALILSILLVGVYFAMKVKDKVARICLLFILIILFIVLYVNADRILLYLIDKNNFHSLELKLNGMYEILVSDGDVSDTEFSGRIERYTRDFYYILFNPIFGVLSYVPTGKHSHILDYLAQYGIPIGIMYMSIVFMPLKRLQLKQYSGIYVTVIAFFIIAMMNTITHSFSIVLYIIAPLYFYMLKEREENG